jgi:hypothetical protein
MSIFPLTIETRAHVVRLKCTLLLRLGTYTTGMKERGKGCFPQGNYVAYQKHPYTKGLVTMKFTLRPTRLKCLNVLSSFSTLLRLQFVILLTNIVLIEQSSP